MVSKAAQELLPKEKLEYLKNIQLLSRKQIADMYNISEIMVKRLLSLYGIKSAKGVDRSIKYIDTTKPIQQYSVNTITKSKELQERLHKETSILDGMEDITNSHRYYFLKNAYTHIPKCKACENNVKLDLEYPKKVFAEYCLAECSSSNGKRTQDTISKLNDIEYLKKLRFEDKLSLEEIAKDVNTTVLSIKNAFSKNGIDVEKYSWTIKNPEDQIKKRIESRGISTYGKEKYDQLTDKEYLQSLWDSGMMIKEIAAKLDVGSWVISDLFRYIGIEYDPNRWLKDGSSTPEKEMLEYISSLYEGEIIQGYRKKYNEYEIDIYIPELKIGFEHNGIYHHSTERKPRLYHRNKVNYWNNSGIRIIQIWGTDWGNHKEKCKKFIRNILQKNTERIGARKCSVVKLCFSEYSKFLEENHFLGTEHCGERYGLVYNGNILSVMGFKRRDNSGNWELTRFSNTNVSGGFSKLLKCFIKEHSPNNIISLADLEIVDRNKNVYISYGFKEKTVNEPTYWYYNPKTKTLDHKFKWRKKSFIKYGISIEGKTESELAKEYGLLTCFDSGKILYELDLTIDNQK